MDQPRGSTYLLEVDKATKSTYLSAFYKSYGHHTFCMSVIRRPINSWTLLRLYLPLLWPYLVKFGFFSLSLLAQAESVPLLLSRRSCTSIKGCQVPLSWPPSNDNFDWYQRLKIDDGLMLQQTIILPISTVDEICTFTFAEMTRTVFKLTSHFT